VDRAWRMVTTMEQNSPAEELPALYRAILDRVAELETEGARLEAARMRATATRVYSRAWDERARRDLESLLRHAARPGSDVSTTGRPRSVPGTAKRPAKQPVAS
jgi:hypothetical protein